jgi:hypothetical protein
MSDLRNFAHMTIIKHPLLLLARAARTCRSPVRMTARLLISTRCKTSAALLCMAYQQAPPLTVKLLPFQLKIPDLNRKHGRETNTEIPRAFPKAGTTTGAEP